MFQSKTRQDLFYKGEAKLCVAPKEKKRSRMASGVGAEKRSVLMCLRASVFCVYPRGFSKRERILSHF
jgi:hypothetical protein